MSVRYAELADLHSLDLPEAALEGMTADGIDPEDHLDKAAGKINSYLRGRTRLPLVEPYPDEIVSANSALAAYSILSARGFDANSGSDHNVRMRYDDTMRWLKSFANGEVNIEFTADTTLAHDGGPIVRSQCRDRAGWRFSR